jgi:hypothetical protein
MPLTPEEFESKYPLILGWIEQTLASHAAQARSVATLGFRRLPGYFQPELLQRARVVYVERVPKPPLSAIGLHQFADFENRVMDGITYLDTFFVRMDAQGRESLHFHELVHVIQWETLGPEGFVRAYADGLDRIGYRQSPLEVMAYTLESVFRNSASPFDAATIVREQLQEM